MRHCNVWVQVQCWAQESALILCSLHGSRVFKGLECCLADSTYLIWTPCWMRRLCSARVKSAKPRWRAWQLILWPRQSTISRRRSTLLSWSALSTNTPGLSFPASQRKRHSNDLKLCCCTNLRCYMSPFKSCRSYSIGTMYAWKTWIVSVQRPFPYLLRSELFMHL